MKKKKPIERAEKIDFLKVLQAFKPRVDAAIEKVVPRKYGKKEFEFATGGAPRYAVLSDEATRALSEPIWDLLDRGGKRWRPALMLLVIEALGKKPGKFLEFAAIPEVVHNGCISEDALVWMADGQPKHFSEIKAGDEVISLEGNFGIAKHKVERVIDNGVKEVYAIRTPNRLIEATDEHPFLVACKNQPLRVRVNSAGRAAIEAKLAERGETISDFCEKINALLQNRVSKGHLKNALYGFPHCCLPMDVAFHVLLLAGLRDGDFLEEVKLQFGKAEISFNWKKACELKQGDLVVIAKNVFSSVGTLPAILPAKQNYKDRCVLPSEFSEELAQLCGFLVGDGCIDEGRVFLCIPSNADGRQEYEALVERIFKAKPTTDKHNITICSKAVAQIFHDLELDGKCLTKKLPSWVFALPEKFKKAFIKGYADADATVDKKGTTKFDTANKKLAAELKFLLDGLGFVTSNLHTKTVDNTHFKRNVSKPTTTLHGFALYSRERVLNEIGTEISTGRQRLLMKMARHVEFRHEQEIPSLPETFDISRLGFCKVVSVKKIGLSQTYDIQVNGTHNYIANGMVVHNSLMEDDIEDGSEMRRGKPCTHKLFGIDVAINAGNAMYYLPLLSVFKHKRALGSKKVSQLLEVYSREMINLSLGQGTDIYWHGNASKRPSEKEYLQMCAFKTGTLARMAAKMGAILADGTSRQIEAAGSYAEAIGVAFQIQDDVLNLVAEEEEYGKEIGGDVSEAKQTLIAIHSLANSSAPNKARLLEILRMHSKDPAIIREAIRLLVQSGSIEFAGNKAKELVESAWKQFEKQFPKSPAREKLRAFADFLVERRL